MNSKEFPRALAAVQSGVIKRQIPAIDQCLESSAELSPSQENALADAAVGAFLLSENPYLFAQGLARFNDEVVRPLRKVYVHSRSHTIRILAGLVLLNKGHDDAVQLLIEEVEPGREYCFLAASLLVEAQCGEVLPKLYNLLRKHPPGSDSIVPDTDQDVIFSLLRMVAGLESRLPGDILQRLTGDSAPVNVRFLVKQLWPE